MENTYLNRAYAAWSAGADLRARRERHKRFTYGDQWSDAVADPRGGYIAESDLIVRAGKHPYTNNLIRQLVKTVVGRYRDRARESGRYEGAVREVALANALPEIDARAMEEFLISGCAVQRVVREHRPAGAGVWVDNVDPRRFFVNPYRDPRGWDIELVGMLHDMSLPEVLNRFGGGDRRRTERLRRLFGGAAGSSLVADPIGDAGSLSDFHACADGSKCRVVEVWTFDSRPRRGSATLDFVWHCRWIAPDGTVLAEYDSPYAHGSHPFAVKMYPLTDGEVHSFVEDVIDQQKFINRLIVMMDHIMACSAKGVLLFPIEQLPRGVSIEQVADTWAHADGVIPVTGRGMHLPQQVVTNAASGGGYQLLEMQLRLLEEVSGVSGALMGRTGTGIRGAEMFEGQVRNATLALTDLFETFDAFAAARNAKILAVG